MLTENLSLVRTRAYYSMLCQHFSIYVYLSICLSVNRSVCLPVCCWHSILCLSEILPTSRICLFKLMFHLFASLHECNTTSITSLDHIGPYWTILDHIGPYWTLSNPIGPYWTLSDPILASKNQKVFVLFLYQRYSPPSVGSSLRARLPCLELLWTNMLSETARSGPSTAVDVEMATWNLLMSRGFPAFFRQFWLHFMKNLRKNLGGCSLGGGVGGGGGNLVIIIMAMLHSFRSQVK